MIDAAAQILLTVNSTKPSADKQPLFQNNSTAGQETSFSDYYEQSRSDVQTTNTQATKSAQNQNEDRSPANTQPDNSSTVSKKDNSTQNTKSDRAEVSASKKQTNIDESENQDDSNDESMVATGVDDSQPSEDVTKELNDKAETLIEEILPAEDEAVSQADTLENIALEIEAGTADLLAEDATGTNSDSETLQLKSSAVAQAIVAELESSGGKNNKADENKPSVLASRQQILADIEKVLDKDKLVNENIPPQLLKPDLSTNPNAAKVIVDNLKAKDLAPAINPQLEPDLALTTDSEEALTLESNDSNDALLQKIIERLEQRKQTFDVTQMNKLVTEKANATDFFEQLSTKISNESAGVSPLVQSASLTNRPGMAASPVQQFTMNTQLNQPEWGTDFSKRIQFMINNDIKNAELRLDPPELGRINIKISMNQDQASVVFSSAHGNVREAIENTLPKLREMLSESGIQLGDANVNEGQQQKNEQAQQDAQSPKVATSGFVDSPEDPEITAPVVKTYSVDGVIDYFA